MPIEEITSGANRWQQERLLSLILFVQYNVMDALKGMDLCLPHAIANCMNNFISENFLPPMLYVMAYS